eukprot:TRINITY_DN5934_c0_g1_i2.p1 TRINITY_DN5934_c0_g1~~TRINITY_DN5934_c0_g1_i2.p1  ORF type:complete len:128 (-),score=14.93 TRINITY_DN5934_c0_g1_i2:133-516(-)
MSNPRKEIEELFVDEVHPTYVCDICSSVLTDSQDIVPCGHSFCKRCLEGKTHCPSCSKHIESVIQSTPVFRRLLNNLRIRCPKHEGGCTWVGKRNELAMHLQGEHEEVYEDRLGANFSPSQRQTCPP